MIVLKVLFVQVPTQLIFSFRIKHLSANLKNRVAVLETVASRTVIRETNFLHLNHPKKIWTWVADIFALSLIFLAGTGLFMIKGKNGIKRSRKMVNTSWNSDSNCIFIRIFLEQIYVFCV